MSKKAQTKKKLLENILLNRKLLDKKIAKLTPEQLVWPGSMDTWSVKDILGHLVDWEQRFIGWYEAGLRGETPETPGDGFNWQELPQLNEASYQRRKDHALEDILKEYAESYAQILALVEGMEEEQILTPGLYPWTGKDPLLTWIDGSTATHYHWARRNIRSSVIAKAFRPPREETTEEIND